MEQKDLYEFSSDRPITCADEDLLDRSDFASDLANALASWHGNDSLVVALHGAWGSGKTSIKNMALSQLNSINGNTLDIIEFSPWEWAAQEKITVSFFHELSKVIGHKDKSASGKKLAKTLKKYGRYLNTGESIVSGFSKALPTLFVLATFIGISGNFLYSAWFSNFCVVGLAVLGVLAAALKWGKGFFNILGENIEATVREDEKSLSDIRQDLTDLLTKRNTPLIIVMDDLDRLTSAQLKMVFQLIKANLEFPNVVFLLLFQRDLVEDKMNDGRQLGRDYLEKIIQVPFDIPKIEITKLYDLLFKKLNALITQDKSIEEIFDIERWGNLFYEALYVYFDNLRNVYRYTSTLSFYFSRLKGKIAFEVNPIDLIAIECLRVFEPDVYREISRSKNILTAKDVNKSNIDYITTSLNSLLDKASPDKKEFVKKIIEQLFPTMKQELRRKESSWEVPFTWLREMRVCHPSNFDKYFQFSIPNSELSNSELQEMLSLTSNSEKLSSFILSLKERNILNNALSQFEAFVDVIPLENKNTYINAILDIGDRVDNESTGFMAFSSFTHTVMLIIRFLKRIVDKKERGELLLECFKFSSGISIILNILDIDKNRGEVFDTNNLLLDNEFELLKAEFVKKIDLLSVNSPNELLTNKHLVICLDRWKSWGDKNKVIDWLKIQTESAEGCINLLKSFTVKVFSQSIHDKSIKTTTHIKLKDIEDFIAIEPIQEKICNIDETELDSDGKVALKAFRDAIEKNREGIIDDWTIE